MQYKVEVANTQSMQFTLFISGNNYYRARAIRGTGALFFNAVTFASSSIKQGKTEPKVCCKLSRLNRNGSKNCDFHSRTTSAMTWTRILAKEHQTELHMCLVTSREGGGGHYSREGFIFSLALRDWGTVRDRALFKRALLSREYVISTLRSRNNHHNNRNV